MSDEKNSRVNIEDLPKAEQELTDDEAKGVQGGLPAVQKVRSAAARMRSNDNTHTGGLTLNTDE